MDWVKVLNKIGSLSTQFNAIIRNEEIWKRLSEIHKGMEAFPDNIRMAVQEMASFGWYLDPDMALPDIWNVAAALKEGRFEAAEEILIPHFEERIPEFQKSINFWYPNRIAPINAAFEAHIKGQYLLSIPVFLAQADGICFELTQQEFFQKKNGQNGAARFAQEYPKDKMWYSFMAQFLVPSPRPCLRRID